MLQKFLLGEDRSRDRSLSHNEVMFKKFRDWNFCDERLAGSPRVLLAGGHGYGNVGDEAQCGAAVARWKKYVPGCKVTLFTPHPAYTKELHQEEVAWAPRVAWFQSNTTRRYYDKQRAFYLHFSFIRIRLILTAQLLRRGIPLSLLYPREATVLQQLLDHDILHISGGGFLTGKTRSRLWENCLLMRVCSILGIPYVLTGHNIGVFQSKKDCKLARWGLQGASYIGLRDKGISEKALDEVGVRGEHVESSCDDALLCPRLSSEKVAEVVTAAGADASKAWVAVNFHYWGQDNAAKPKIAKRFATVCDHLVAEYDFQVLFIIMTPTDVEAAEAVISLMAEKAKMIPYSPDYKVVRGIIADSELCFTMKHHPIVFAQGEQVPVVSVALDDYYFHKNLGALANTGDEESLVNAEGFKSNVIFKVIHKVIQDRTNSNKRMREYCDSMRKIESRIYNDFMKLAK